MLKTLPSIQKSLVNFAHVPNLISVYGTVLSGPSGLPNIFCRTTPICFAVHKDYVGYGTSGRRRAVFHRM